MRDDFARLFAPPLDAHGRPNSCHIEEGAISRARESRRGRSPRTRNDTGVRAGHVRLSHAASFRPHPCPRRGERPLVTVHDRRLVSARLMDVEGRPRGGRTSGAGALAGSGRRRGRLHRTVRLPAGKADAARRRARVRPHGGGGAHRRRPLIITSALPLRRRAGATLRAPPRPKWVAPPGQSLHRYGTELDLGPPRHTGGSRQRRALPLRPALRMGALALRVRAQPALAPPCRAAVGAASAVPSFVPARYAPTIARAASAGTCRPRCSPRSSTRSRTSIRLRSARAGAHGIAQFMPGTAHAYGSPTPSTPRASIAAQAHLMRDLLRRFASVRWRSPPTTRPGRSRRAAASRRIPETRGLRRADPRSDGRGRRAAAATLEVRPVS